MTRFRLMLMPVLAIISRYFLGASAIWNFFFIFAVFPSVAVVCVCKYVSAISWLIVSIEHWFAPPTCLQLRSTFPTDAQIISLWSLKVRQDSLGSTLGRPPLSNIQMSRCVCFSKIVAFQMIKISLPVASNHWDNILQSWSAVMVFLERERERERDAYSALQLETIEEAS